MITPVQMLAALMLLPPWHQDVSDSPEARAALYGEAVDAIYAVARTDFERVFLATQAYSETRLSRYVLEERCKDGPRGARCDDGRATGPWQAHRWCAGAWDSRVTKLERFKAGAQCALIAARAGMQACGGVSGAFEYQRGPVCSKAWAAPRVALFRRIKWETEKGAKKS